MGSIHSENRLPKTCNTLQLGHFQQWTFQCYKLVYLHLNSTIRMKFSVICFDESAFYLQGYIGHLGYEKSGTTGNIHHFIARTEMICHCFTFHNPSCKLK